MINARVQLCLGTRCVSLPNLYLTTLEFLNITNAFDSPISFVRQLRSGRSWNIVVRNVEGKAGDHHSSTGIIDPLQCE